MRHTHAASHPLTGMDPRLKLLSALALLVMVISSRTTSFPLLVSVLSLGVCISLGISAKTLLLRFSEPLFIALTVLALKVFFAGHTPLFSLQIASFQLTAHREGLMEGVGIASRIMGGVSLLAVVGFSTPFTELMAALSWLKVPQVLIEISLFAWRYLFLLLEEAQVVYQAQKNRLGYVGCRRGLSSFGTLAGVLVIKAFDNSQSVTTAMMQRGYDGQMPMLLHKPFKGMEVAGAMLIVAALAVIRVI
ncbi:cobalt ECF transporter T component CbiQ [Geomonas sp.]|uniref:cobalt ECF transporter T component CbiQ n=1 Tax=Geomonas sp. TaxID=2651584 RepID=UPI002B463A58|nr:cobalt ECF transporter T component CbiQ [Geomonas sp.]HJV36761.1 cobalt ECF transporter T component CbiQ [Geomonas sp.]